MKSIGSVLFTMYRGTPQHAEWIMACLEGAWPSLIGDRLAASCRPLRVEESRLTIEITDPEWEDALRSMQADLLDRIRTATFGEVSAISIAPGLAPPR